MVTKVLAVDDNPVDLQRIEGLLKAAGYQVITATNGAQAVEAAKNYSPDAILMDVNMPEVDGFSATRTLGADDATKGIPVVLVTSKDQKADKAWGQMLGAKGYITKPYSDEDVLAQLKAI